MEFVLDLDLGAVDFAKHHFSLYQSKRFEEGRIRASPFLKI
jgi:hypothetical protein